MKSILHKTSARRAAGLTSAIGLLACSLMLLSITAHAQFTWPVYEPFGEYTNANTYRLGSNESTNYWNFGNGTSSAQFLITNTAAMSFPALKPDTNAAPRGVQEVPTGSNASADRGGIFTAQTGTFYTSFLLNYQDNGGQMEDRLAYNIVTGAAPGSFTRAYLAVWLTADYRLKVTKNYNEANNILTAKFSAATPVLTRNVPHLIVMRYQKVPGGMDKVDLWVDPAPFGDDSQIPPSAVTTTNGANVASFNGVLLNHRKVNGAAQNTFSWFQVDEIRLASTWSEVTPLATPPPGPMFAVTGGGTGCPGDTFPVDLTGSVTTNDYWLYTNSVYTGVSVTGTGSPLSMGSFSNPGIYSVLASNNVNGNVGWMSNSVTIVVRAAVNIVSEPSPVTTATNNRAQFTVVSTGDQLAFQWYRDGTPLTNDSHITGATSNSLVIWPATVADLGGYYCTITNPCSVSPTFTTTNSLTLDGVDDLIWAGNAFLNIWDVSNPTFPYFVGGLVFNGGDNPTFDDSATTPDQVIITNVLTPTILRVNNDARNYLFAGGGIIAGDGTLIKTGVGRLIISNSVSAGVFLANPYTGGTVISNGTVFVQGASTLGSGPITLAGGTLETFNKLVFTNNVNVTANSTCQLDQTGNQSITLAGGFNFSPGTTLTFTNSATTTNSPNWVVLTSAFTNSGNIVLSVRDVATNSTQFLSCNISTNAQVFNGVISEITFPGPVGGGGLIKQGAGAVYLNGANTYTALTTNTAGLLAGSGSINSPLIVAPGATLGAGSPTSIGTFTVNSNVTLNGNAYIRVNKSLAQSNDLVSVTGALTNGGTGTVTITNLGVTALVEGDTFKLFSRAVSNGNTLTVTGGGIFWKNNLAIDGSIQATLIATYPTNISYSISGDMMTLSWPTTHLGWILQSQTNSLEVGLATTWYDIISTTNVTSTIIPLNPANPAVFYRLRHP